MMYMLLSRVSAFMRSRRTLLLYISPGNYLHDDIILHNKLKTIAVRELSPILTLLLRYKVYRLSNL